MRSVRKSERRLTHQHHVLIQRPRAPALSKRQTAHSPNRFGRCVSFIVYFINVELIWVIVSSIFAIFLWFVFATWHKMAHHPSQWTTWYVNVCKTNFIYESFGDITLTQIDSSLAVLQRVVQQCYRNVVINESPSDEQNAACTKQQ